MSARLILPCDFDLSLAALVNQFHDFGIDATTALLADAEFHALRREHRETPPCAA